MEFLLIAYFGIVNILIFRLLVGHTLMKSRLILLLLMIILFSFYLVVEIYVTREAFFILNGFSASIFIFHFGGLGLLWVLENIIKSPAKYFLKRGITFTRKYLIYLLVFVIQVYSIISQCG